jgi:hypothetical protein
MSRELVCSFCGRPWVSNPCVCGCGTKKAADEIERLRAEVERLQNVSKAFRLTWEFILTEEQQDSAVVLYAERGLPPGFALNAWEER